MNDSPAPCEPALEDLRWLRALAARLVRDPHTADDAVQETLVAALERGPRERASLRGWMAAILRNALRQEWRGRARRARREEGLPRVDEERSTLAVVEELALHRRLVERVHALAEPYRTAIVLHYLRGKSVEDMARELALPPKTVRTHLERGVARLRERLGNDRSAWALVLALPRPTPLAPVLVPVLVPMNLKVLAPVLGLVLVGAWLYRREPASRGLASGPADARESMLAAPVVDAAPAELSGARREAAPLAVSAPVAPGLAAAPALVHGFVRALDGTPLAGVPLVFAARERERYVRAQAAPVLSAADGSFALALPAETGRLEVAADELIALVMPTLDGTLPLDPPIVVAAPRRAYAGRVVDPSGTPVPRAHVELTLDGSFVQSLDVGGAAVHVLLPFVETTGDEEGFFRLDPAGWVEGAHLAAAADGFENGRFELPHASDEALELVLAPARPGARTVFGLVQEASGTPAPGAQVSLGGVTVASDAEGRFTLECEPWRDRGVLHAVKPGALPGEVDLAEALRGTREQPVVLTLGGEPLSIRGRLVDASGAPVAGATVWTQDTTPFGAVQQQHGENSFLGHTTVEALLGQRVGPWSSPVQATTDADGEFALADLLPRAYAVFALDPRTLDGLGPVPLVGGEENARLVLPREPTRPIAGRVVSRRGQPLAGVRVALGRQFDWPQQDPIGKQVLGFPLRGESAGWSFPDQAVETDAEGRFAFAPLVPGGTFLALRGKALVLGQAFPLDDCPDLGAIELQVDASSRVRLELARASEADAFGMVDENDEVRALFIEVDGMTISAGRADLRDGRSGVVLTSEGVHTVVLYSGGIEVRRFELEFPAGGPHVLTP